MCDEGHMGAVRDQRTRHTTDDAHLNGGLHGRRQRALCALTCAPQPSQSPLVLTDVLAELSDTEKNAFPDMAPRHLCCLSPRMGVTFLISMRRARRSSSVRGASTLPRRSALQLYRRWVVVGGGVWHDAMV